MLRYIVIIFLFVGLFQWENSLPVQAATEAFPLTSPPALSAQLILKPMNGTVETADLIAAAEIIKTRLSQLELEGSYNVEVEDGELRLTLSEGQDLPYIAAIVTSMGHIEFIDGGTESPPLGEQIETGTETNLNQGIYQSLFTSSQIIEFVPPTSGDIFFQLLLNDKSAAVFANFVKVKPNNIICMVMDKEVINCSSMYYWSPDTLEIVPNLSGNSAITMNDLAVFIHSGPLPIHLEIVE